MQNLRYGAVPGPEVLRIFKQKQTAEKTPVVVFRYFRCYNFPYIFYLSVFMGAVYGAEPFTVEVVCL